MKALFSPPILCFIAGIAFSFFKSGFMLPQRLHKMLTLSVLFLIGLKGGGPLIEHFNDEAPLLLGSLVLWGMIHPFIAYFLLKRTTGVDRLTAAAISASFGSISVMTFASGAAFLESLQIGFEKLLIGALAILEIPAIFSGLILAKRSGDWKKMVFEALFNQTILALFIGIAVGASLYFAHLEPTLHKLSWGFNPLLSLFLFDMGLHVGFRRKHLQSFSWPLTFFGFYMPLIGGLIGILISYFLNIDVGTGTLIAILLASASYIAVPAAMKIALPQAKESIYLPLALGITFPFNLFVGIPIYFQLAKGFLS